MTSPNPRPSPAIPDHEVLRKIGGGAYGEVWLARGVTGAMRAVKVVWRQDFEDDRTFEREFDGILKFEPMSRDHPGLVNILHVGRSRGEQAFYYYVMELGDDVHSGSDINPVEYEALTLRGDHHEGLADQWPISDCIEIGLSLAEALQHLHENGLAHRDVKPSNVIFVGGKAKLADIGLVAARGQRTFVGTEGFVPPEGPGSAKADIYSLGKVLYEITTGMDRMNFPELPEKMPGGRDRKLWLELNRIICEVCEPRITKRKISSAAELANSLRRLKHGKRRRPRGISLAVTSLFLVSVIGWGMWQATKDMGWGNYFQPSSNDESKPVEGLYRIFSTPEGADVIDESGVTIGTTPTQAMRGKVGDQIKVILRKDGFRPLPLGGTIKLSSVEEPMILFGEMQIFSPPELGMPWEDQFGQSYQPDGDAHISHSYVNRELWEQAVKVIRANARDFDYLKTTNDGQPVEIVLTTQDLMERFGSWMRDQGLEAGFLTQDLEVVSVFEESFVDFSMSEKAKQQKLRPFRLRVNRIDYGSLYITSTPSGAELSVNGETKGLTHGEMLVQRIKPGKIEIQLVLEGYKRITKKYDLNNGQRLELHIEMEKNRGVVFGAPWKNELGMKFVPVGEDLMASVWETRVKDFDLFSKEKKLEPPMDPTFEQGDSHPVVNVTRDDAKAFCEWLTQRERKRERIAANHTYRLPTDIEWSRLVGLVGEDPDASPGARDARKKRRFPWGLEFAEKDTPGNFADMTAALMPDIESDQTILGYDDGYAYTSPVGTYGANSIGICDLSGNVQEWVSDPYSKQAPGGLGVMRGGGWNTHQEENLFSGSRNAVKPSTAGEMYGFRVLLERKPLQIPIENEGEDTE
ncbi:MAG: SUMF1/EgtB/PvdO family nonheme iron enzyme [Luteolibacter sp.]